MQLIKLINLNNKQQTKKKTKNSHTMRKKT